MTTGRRVRLKTLEPGILDQRPATGLKVECVIPTERIRSTPRVPSYSHMGTEPPAGMKVSPSSNSGISVDSGKPRR
jgi:hypothetical protein